MAQDDPLPPQDLARLEGMLLAHRRILSLLLARHADPELIEALEARSVMHDHQEDPGAVPTDGLAILAAEAEEFRLIAERLQREKRPEEVTPAPGPY